MLRVNDPRLLKWAEIQLNADFTNAGTLATIGADYMGVVVYNNYAHRNINMSIATTSPKWASRGFLKAMFHYPFEQLDCRRVTGITAASNMKTIDLLERLGFIYEGRLREFFGEDALVYGMLKGECRWL